MYKIFSIALIALVLAGCSKDLTELNEDPKNPTAVPAVTLLTNSLNSFSRFMNSTNVNTNNFRLWAQHWTETQYTDEANYDLVGRNVNGRTWNTLYATVIKDVTEARKAVAADAFLSEEVRRNQNAILNVVEVVAYSILVDIFGDVPYTQALTEDLTPGYDDDKAIYADLLVRLSTAIENLEGESDFGSGDLIYGGNTAAWKKFANSWKLKMAVRIADFNPADGEKYAKEAITSGTFTSMADNYVFQYESSTPFTNPLWVDLVQSGRDDFAASSTLANVLNDLNDPRRPAFFQNLDADGAVIGGVPGATTAYASHSQASQILRNPTFEGTIMDYTDVLFLMADVANRGWDAGSAADYYHSAITSSILYWEGTSALAASYIAQADVAYDTAPGTWKEKIAKQKWIALYNQGFEAWTTYRMYDAPEMQLADVVQTVPPNRFTYPTQEYSVNGESIGAAASAMGGDLPFSRVFWDVP